MAHLIDRDVVLAEIENLLDKSKYHEEYDCAYRDGNNGALYALKGKVNSLKVKEVEVDLEKEIGNYISSNFFGSQTMGFFSNRTKEEPNDQDIALCAKHFFELGLRVSNPLTWEDIDWIVGEAVCRVSEDSETEQICKEVLKRFKEQKGEKV